MALDWNGLSYLRNNFFIDDNEVKEDNTYKISFNTSLPTNGHNFDWFITCDDCHR